MKKTRNINLDLIKVMGIDIEKERQAKKEFLETVVPQWVKEAKANGKLAEDTATKQ